LAGASWAAFADKGEVLGSTFSVGSANIRLLQDLAGGIDPSNLVEQLTGPSFQNISPNWNQNYLVKLYNNGTSQMQLTTHARYVTTNDPQDLRTLIYVEPFKWNDANANGVLDTGEEGTSLGRKTLVKWSTEGYDLGTLATGQIQGVLLKFSTDAVSDSKQGATAIIDFVFDSIGI